MKIDLNADLAEGFPFDDELLQIVTTANISLGAHAGSPELALATADKCRALGVRVCLHPGYPDRAGMGRASWPEPDAAVQESLASQLSLMPGDCVKPHGAFYHDSASRPEFADLLAELLHSPLIGFPIGMHEQAALRAGQPFWKEGFVDRAYLDDGSLAPRSRPGAVLSRLEDICAQALRLAPRVDTLCLHGDTPGCVEIARAVRSALKAAGWEVSA